MEEKRNEFSINIFFQRHDNTNFARCFFSENDIKPIHVWKELTYPCPAKDERYKRWGDGEEINETEREP